MRRIAQDTKAFARMFSKWCASQGLTPSQGSVALGYRPDIGNKWANGKSAPPIKRVRALSEKMGLPAASILRAVEASRLARLGAGA